MWYARLFQLSSIIVIGSMSLQLIVPLSGCRACLLAERLCAKSLSESFDCSGHSSGGIQSTVQARANPREAGLPDTYDISLYARGRIRPDISLYARGSGLSHLQQLERSNELQ